MAHFVVSIFFFAVMMVVTAVVFGVWLIVGIFRFFIRLLVGPAPRRNWVMGRVTCDNPRCLAVHPQTANFCRRCGRRLVQATGRFPMGRAAMW
jgi:hypothetical protein